MAVTPTKTKYAGVTFIEVARPSGGTEKSFYVTYREPSTGKLKNVCVGRQHRDDMTAARASGIRAELIEGKRKTKKEERAEEAARLTIESLWTKYNEDNGHKTSLHIEKYRIKHFKHLFSRTPQEIATADIDALKKRLEAAGKSPQTVKNTLELLRRIINYGVKKELCDMPARLQFTMPEVDNIVTECLDSDQLQRLCTALEQDRDQTLAALMRLALATGIRRGALFALEWTDIDFQKGFITLRGKAAKKRKTEIIPLNDVARGILEGVAKTESNYVFPGRGGNKRVDIRRFLWRIRKAAGLPKDFRPLHGLRHTFASGLASSGAVDLYILQKLLTHSSPQMTQRYAHLANAALHRAAGVAADLFSGLAPKTSEDEDAPEED